MNSFFSDSHIGKSAKFLTGFKKFNLLNRYNDGLCIDGRNKISLKRSMQHALVLAPSGAGKTTSYIIPNLLRLKQGSAIVLDPSQEIYNLCSSYLSKNFEVHMLNVTDLSKSGQWNPLEKATTPEDRKMISEAIITSAYPNSQGSDKFWEDGARSLINVLLEAVSNIPEKRSLFYIYQLLNRFNHDQDTVNTLLAENLSENMWLTFKGLVTQPEKVFGSQLATAKISLSPLDSPALAKLTSGKSTIDFAAFRKKPSILFIVVPEHLVKNFSFFLSLLYRELFETFMEVPKKEDLPVYMLLDEVGNTFVNGLSGYITTLRKRKVSVSLILQSTRQLYSLYNDDADTILENTLNHLYFPGLSLETCQKLSNKIGFRYTDQQSAFFPTNKKEYNREALMSAESIRTLKDNRAIYLYANLPPVMLRLKPWYKSLAMKLKLRKGRRSR